MSSYRIVIENNNYSVDVESGESYILSQDNSRYITIEVAGEQGPPGPAGAVGSSASAAIVDTASYNSPTTITSSIVVPTDARARIFLVGSAVIVNPGVNNGSGTNELHVVGTSNTNTIELNSTTNLLLSGKIILRAGTYLVLHWVTGLNKWVEVTRNEI